MFEHFKEVITRMSNPIMSNKIPLCMVCYLGSQETYIIDFLCAEAIKCDLYVFPVEIMSDFELPSVQSFELQFHDACIHDCYFHFSQCLWRKYRILDWWKSTKKMDVSGNLYKRVQPLLCTIQFCSSCLG